MKKQFDPRLYLVTDRTLMRGRTLEAVITAAVAGGVTAVQLREKTCCTREFVLLARRLKKILTPLKTALIINDRLDIVLAADADGLHLGQDDLPLSDARRLLGTDKIIGLSLENLQQLQDPALTQADYLGASPIFLTSTKSDTKGAWGLDGLRQLRQQTSLPIVAIGGIHQGNAAQVLAAGADGIAVVSAICGAPDIHAAAHQLRQHCPP